MRWALVPLSHAVGAVGPDPISRPVRPPRHHALRVRVPVGAGRSARAVAQVALGGGGRARGPAAPITSTIIVTVTVTDTDTLADAEQAAGLLTLAAKLLERGKTKKYYVVHIPLY